MTTPEAAPPVAAPLLPAPRRRHHRCRRRHSSCRRWRSSGRPNGRTTATPWSTTTRGWPPRTTPTPSRTSTAENAYTEARTAHLAALRDTIFNEIKARTKETDLSLPDRKGGYWYYSRTVEGKQYDIHCRRAVAPGEIDPPLHRGR